MRRLLSLLCAVGCTGLPAPLVATEQTEDVDIFLVEERLEPGQVREFPFRVPEAAALEIFYSVVDGLRVDLRSPAGTLAQAKRTQGPDWEGAALEVAEPAAGEWTLLADASAVKQAHAFMAAGGVEMRTFPRLETSPREVEPGSSVTFRGWFEGERAPVRGASWSCEITSRDGSHFAVPLSDDGSHGDGGPDDGVFGASATAPGSVGIYEAVVTVTLPPERGGATLYVGDGFRVRTLEDLVVAKDSVALDGENRIVAILKNEGASAVHDAEVELLKGDATLATARIALMPKETCEIAFPFALAPSEPCRLRVSISPFTLPEETDYANNTGELWITPGQAAPRPRVPRLKPCRPTPPADGLH